MLLLLNYSPSNLHLARRLRQPRPGVAYGVRCCISCWPLASTFHTHVLSPMFTFVDPLGRCTTKSIYIPFSIRYQANYSFCIRVYGTVFFFSQSIRGRVLGSESHGSLGEGLFKHMRLTKATVACSRMCYFSSQSASLRDVCP